MPLVRLGDPDTLVMDVVDSLLGREVDFAHHQLAPRAVDRVAEWSGNALTDDVAGEKLLADVDIGLLGFLDLGAHAGVRPAFEWLADHECGPLAGRHVVDPPDQFTLRLSAAWCGRLHTLAGDLRLDVAVLIQTAHGVMPLHSPTSHGTETNTSLRSWPASTWTVTFNHNRIACTLAVFSRTCPSPSRRQSLARGQLSARGTEAVGF